MRHSGLYSTSPSIEVFPGVRMDIIRRLEQPKRGQVRQPAAFEGRRLRTPHGFDLASLVGCARFGRALFLRPAAAIPDCGRGAFPKSSASPKTEVMTFASTEPSW